MATSNVTSIFTSNLFGSIKTGNFYVDAAAPFVIASGLTIVAYKAIRFCASYCSCPCRKKPGQAVTHTTGQTTAANLGKTTLNAAPKKPSQTGQQAQSAKAPAKATAQPKTGEKAQAKATVQTQTGAKAPANGTVPTQTATKPQAKQPVSAQPKTATVATTATVSGTNKEPPKKLTADRLATAARTETAKKEDKPKPQPQAQKLPLLATWKGKEKEAEKPTGAKPVVTKTPSVEAKATATNGKA